MDKGRRGFLAGLVGAPAVGLVRVQEDMVMPSDDVTRGGWRFRWVDWRQAEAMDLVYGVWVAEGPDGRRAHWTTRGRGDWHQPGSVFDLTGHRDWPELDGGSSEQALRAAKRRAFLALVEFIHG